jgi:hypothetical protein
VSPLDLIRAKDGSMSLTKLAASTAHLLMAVGFALITWRQGYIDSLWLTYGGLTIVHAMSDKAVARIAAFKDKQLDAETPGTVTTTATVTKEVSS